MASLDVLDYLQGLDAALANRLPAALRRQALRDARRIVDAMAFRFALLDDRPMPEDQDYLRAIEVMKPAERAAEVLARRRPHYERVRSRRLATTFLVLGVLGLVVAGLAYLGTSEVSEPLATVTHAQQTEDARTLERQFDIAPDMNRVYLAGTVFVSGDNRGNIDIFLRGPDNQTKLLRSYSDRGTYYVRENVYGPASGEWTLFVDFNGARGSLQLDVAGIRPAR